MMNIFFKRSTVLLFFLNVVIAQICSYLILSEDRKILFVTIYATYIPKAVQSLYMCIFGSKLANNGSPLGAHLRF